MFGNLVAELMLYEKATVLRRWTDGALSEYPINPEALIDTLLANRIETPCFTTGLINPRVILRSQMGDTVTVVEYRPPSVTGIWLEGVETPLRVPLPGMIMVGRFVGMARSMYVMAAVKGGRPQTLDTMCYHIPLPNVSFGSICWGSISLPDPGENFDLAPIWSAFLGTEFGNHSVSGKSVRNQNDVRITLFELNDEQAQIYPEDDLVEHRELSRFI